MATFARSGLLQGVVVQTGSDVSTTSKSQDIRAIADDTLVFGGLERNGRHYHRIQSTAYDGTDGAPIEVAELQQGP